MECAGIIERAGNDAAPRPADAAPTPSQRAVNAGIRDGKTSSGNRIRIDVQTISPPTKQQLQGLL
jgi:hypothetical protein